MKLVFTDRGGFELRVEALHVEQLHGGLLMDPVFADFVNSKTKHAYERFEHKVRNLWGDRPIQLLGDLPLVSVDNCPSRRQWVLSAYIVAVWLFCGKTIHDDDAHASQCVVIWVQGCKEPLLPKRVRDMIQWESMAGDFRY